MLTAVPVAESFRYNASDSTTVLRPTASGFFVPIVIPSPPSSTAKSWVRTLPSEPYSRIIAPALEYKSEFLLDEADLAVRLTRTVPEASANSIADVRSVSRGDAERIAANASTISPNRSQRRNLVNC
jgi:hypothetical protein